MSEPVHEQPRPSPHHPPLKRGRGAILVGSIIAAVVFAGVVFLIMAVNDAGSAFDKMAESETRVYEPPMFATGAEATKACGIKLPAEARNVQVVTRKEWLEYEEYVRFEGPVSACLSHASDVVDGEPLLPVPASQLQPRNGLPSTAASEGPIQPGNFGPRPIGLGPAPGWFDLSSAINVVGAGGGSRKPQVWVDQTRGVYYYHLGS
jgi:hypothetical protein